MLAHVPRPYWRVTATLRARRQPLRGHLVRPGVRRGRRPRSQGRPDLRRGARARDRDGRERRPPRSASETRKPSRESAPPLFDLTSLQREAQPALLWSARRTLSAAQRCYERHKLLTYPRTEQQAACPRTTATRSPTTLASFAETRRRDEGFADLRGRGRAACARAASRTRRASSTTPGISDHFAIVPTGALPREPLTGDDKRLFDLVARRFLGAFHPPALWERVERTTVAASESFRTRARTLVVPGWRSVLADERARRRRRRCPRSSPGAERGERRRGARARGEESRPRRRKPPARITEARLLSLMENAGQQIDDEDVAAVLHEKGIGTPATRADIIENLIAQGLRGAGRQGAAPDRQGHPHDRHAAAHPHRPPHLARAHRRDRVPPARGRARRAHAQRLHGRDRRLHGRDRRPREELRLRRALRRERDVRQLPELRRGP